MTTTIDTGQTKTGQPAGRWQLDPNDSRVEFRIKHLWGLTTVTGRFDDLSGALTVADDGSRCISLEIEAASLDTGNPQRDRHLRSDDFFDTANHPLIYFNSTEIADDGPDCIRVTGRLEAAGRAVELTFLANLSQNDDGLEIHTTATIDQRQLGMTWSPLHMVRGSATVLAHARLQSQ